MILWRLLGFPTPERRLVLLCSGSTPSPRWLSRSLMRDSSRTSLTLTAIQLPLPLKEGSWSHTKLSLSKKKWSLWSLTKLKPKSSFLLLRSSTLGKTLRASLALLRPWLSRKNSSRGPQARLSSLSLTSSATMWISQSLSISMKRNSKRSIFQ